MLPASETSLFSKNLPTIGIKSLFFVGKADANSTWWVCHVHAQSVKFYSFPWQIEDFWLYSLQAHFSDEPLAILQSLQLDPFTVWVLLHLRMETCKIGIPEINSLQVSKF